MQEIIAFLSGLGVTPLELLSLVALVVLWRRLRQLEDICFHIDDKEGE